MSSILKWERYELDGSDFLARCYYLFGVNDGLKSGAPWE